MMLGSRRLNVGLSAMSVGLAACLVGAPCRADVSTTGKGMVGGGLLGAELVLTAEALIGVQQPWIYGVSVALGAGGGAVGGYFIERATQKVPEIPLLMTVAGLGLVIPALIVYVDATHEFRDNAPAAQELPADPAADPPAPDSGRELTLLERPSMPTGPALVSLRAGALSTGLPSVHVGSVYTPLEVQQFSVTQATQVLVPLFGGSF